MVELEQDRTEQRSAARSSSTHLGQDLTPSSDRRAAAGFRSTVIAVVAAVAPRCAAGAAAPELEAIDAAEGRSCRSRRIQLGLVSLILTNKQAGEEKLRADLNSPRSL